MKIIVDNKIPYIKGALEPFAKTIYKPGAEIMPEDTKNADALVVRTRTLCNKKLLANSKVKFIATATIGFDHIDTAYCKKSGIEWANAPKCNSGSVKQYIASALMFLSQKHHFSLANKTIGIVGVGNVGKKISNICNILGMNVLLNDPPRARKEGADRFVELSKIAEEADIISLHVPLNKKGVDKTYHIVDELLLKKMKKKPFIINSCRGEVVETSALKSALKNRSITGAVIDCWENEPAVDTELLKLCDIGTPHIAGYSKDGKANGTQMSIQAISRFFNLGIDNWQCKNIELPKTTIINVDNRNKTEQQILSEGILATYSIEEDDRKLRNSVETFEKQREEYPVRREFESYKIKKENIPGNTITKLKKLGFKII